MQPALTAGSPPLDTATILDESQCIGICCSGSRGRMSPPPQVFLTPSPPPKAGTSTAPKNRAVIASHSSSGPTCGKSLRGSNRFWGSSLRFLTQTRGVTGKTSCKKYWRSGHLPPPGPKSWKTSPTSSGLYSNWTLPPTNHWRT